MSKIDEYRKNLHQHDEAKQEKAKLFDVKALAANTRETCSIIDEDLGIIQYRLLSSKELRELALDKLASDEEKAERVVYAMLKKADPNLTYEDYEDLPFDVKAVLVSKLSLVFTSFLQRLQQSGLTQTPKPN